MQVEGERGKAIEAGLYPNPRVGYIGDQIGQKNMAGGKTFGEFQGGFIRQEIVTAGKLRLSRDKYLARLSAAEFQEQAQWYRVANDVRIQYYRSLGITRRVNIERELLKTQEDNLVTTREKFNVGQANEADVHQAQVMLQQERLNVEAAENEQQMAWQGLTTAVGSNLPFSPLAGTLEGGAKRLDWKPALDRVLAESPELGMAKAKLRGDKITLQREKVEPIPNIFLQANAGYNDVQRIDVYGATAYVEVPIFDRNQGTIRQAKADLARQEAQVRLVELDLRRRLADAYRRYLTARQHVEDFRKVILPESEKRYRTNLESYKNNRETWTVVLESQADFFNLRQQYTMQLVEWREAQTAIEGMLLTDGLMAPPGITPQGHIDAVPKPR